MTKERARKYQWYVDPSDSYTNEVLSREITEENTAQIKDDKGSPRKVYLVTAQELSKFRRSRSQLGISFRILVQEGGGKIRDVTFLPKTTRKKTAFPQPAQAVK